MLQQGRVPTETRRAQYYDVIAEQSERVSLLVDNVLDLARMEDGKREFTRENVDSRELLQEITTRIQHQVQHMGFRFNVQLADDLPSINADRTAIGEAVINLLDNAVKYSGGADTAEVRAFMEREQLVIEVQDHGIGIDSSDLGHVFERFYRGGDHLSRSVRGSGLGLTLVKQIVTAHGGTVHVESVPGRGSTFRIRLPLGCDGQKHQKGS
jgi:two-component system phosphate regulon sensor histidine kinase PhoR